MPTKHFEIMANYDPLKHKNSKITGRIETCLKLFKKGDIISPSEFAKSNIMLLKNKSSKIDAIKNTVDKTIHVAKELGIVSLIQDKPISYADFCNLDTIQYFVSQLRGSKLKNLESNSIKDNTTKRHYVQQIYHFNNWLHDKEFEFSTITQLDIDTFKKTKTRIKLDGIEHFLQLFQNSQNTDSEYIKVIKLYLMDQIQSKCSAKYMSVKHSAITSYFDRNDSPLKFKYSPFNNHADYKEENANATITLDEVYKMITQSGAVPLEKAVVLCRFHRGLDSSTLADRFNFQVWEQLTKWFGHSDFENWDLTKCPVPIKLTRVKTNYLHTGYLEHDAIVAIQEYLNYRYQSYLRKCRNDKVDSGYILEKNQIMQNGKPLFVTINNKPITVNWASRLVPRLAIKSGIQKRIAGSQLQNKNEKIGHELRDLLKSTLIVSGCQDYVCQLAIGHTVNDSYEKQDKLYPDHSRSEYAKASKQLNIFSKITSVLNGTDETEQLKEQVSLLETKIDEKDRTERERVDEMVRSSISKVFEQKHNAIEEQFVKGQALYKLKISKLEKEAGSKHQQEKELMSELSDMAKESGKSFVEVMSDLIKSNKIKAK
jgi:hypothetical protein